MHTCVYVCACACVCFGLNGCVRMHSILNLQSHFKRTAVKKIPLLGRSLIVYLL